MAVEQFTSKLLEAIISETKDRVIKEALMELLPQLKQKVECITFTTEEAATYLGISDQTLRTMCQQKQIPHTRARGKYLFRKKALDAWMDQQEHENCKIAVG